MGDVTVTHKTPIPEPLRETSLQGNFPDLAPYASPMRHHGEGNEVSNNRHHTPVLGGPGCFPVIAMEVFR